MKKIIVWLMLVGCLTTLAGCTTLNSAKEELDPTHRFIKIERIKDVIDYSGAYRSIVYDSVTKVCYYRCIGTMGSGISPYYIVNDEGKAEVAIYGVNYGKPKDN